jgi:hypothetical protein
VNTFVPFDDLGLTASILDYRRLGKQRVECKQILAALMGETTAYINHPATQMWRGYSDGLVAYAAVMCNEWARRGYDCTLRDYFGERLVASYRMPPWWGDDDVHESHRSNLLRKDFDHYTGHGLNERIDWAYVWPEACANPDHASDGWYSLRMSKPDIKRWKNGERYVPDNLDALTTGGRIWRGGK